MGMTAALLLKRRAVRGGSTQADRALPSGHLWRMGRRRRSRRRRIWSRTNRPRAVRVQRPEGGGSGGVVQSPPGSGCQLAVAIAAAATAVRIRLRTATTARMGAAAVGRVERLRLRTATTARMGAAAVGRVERPNPEVAAAAIRARLAGVHRLSAGVHRLSARFVHLRASPSRTSGPGMEALWVERTTPEVAAPTTRARPAAGVHRLSAGVHRLRGTPTLRATIVGRV